MIDKGNYYQWYKKGYQEHDTRAWKDNKVSETLCTKGGDKGGFKFKKKRFKNTKTHT